MKNIHILSTSNPSRLYYNNNDKQFQLCEIAKENTILKSNKNIYITSDEEIGTDEYYFHLKNNEYYNSGRIDEIDKDMKFWRKIILTTDQDLIKDGVQAIPDEFLEWFVKNPSCEEVEVKNETLYEHIDTYRPYPSDCKNLSKTKTRYYLSIIPKKELKQEALEEAAEKSYPLLKITNNSSDIFVEEENLQLLGYRRSFIKGAKWQQERSYTLEQISELFIGGKNSYFDDYLDFKLNLNGENPKQTKPTFKEWFEQFKKK